MVGAAVARADVDDALRAIRSSTAANTPNGRLLALFKDAIVQPEWSRDENGKVAKTGKILTGDEALANPIAIFGHVENMKIFLHPDKSEQALAMADPDIADLYQAASADPQP